MLMPRTAIHPLKIVAAVGAAFLLWGLVLAYASSPAWAAEITVNTTDDEQNADGDCSLREAITAANTDATVDGCVAGSGEDTINLPSGTYLLSSQLPNITSTVTIDGGSPNPTIDGGNAVRLFFVASGAKLSLNELTLTKGNTASENGGAIRNQGSLVVSNSTLSGNTTGRQAGAIFNEGTLEVSNSTLSGNTSTFGGGAIRNQGSLVVNNSTLSGNTTEFGGGAIFNLGTLQVSDSIFSNNSDSGGGGAIRNEGTLEVTNSTLSGNTTANAGGAIGNTSSATATVTNSTFSGNSASNTGGAISNQRTLEVTNSTFFGNSANEGGGIWNHSEITLTVTNSTFSGNSAAAGGGIFNDSGAVTLRNTIVANSPSGGDCSGATDGGYNLVEDGSCITEATSLSGDPNLGPLQDNGGPTQTMALQDGSPAIDAIPDGTNGCGTDITQDQRGVSRPQGSACDIGAFEVDQPPIVTINQAAGQADPTTDSPIHFTAVFNEPVTDFTDSDVTLSGTAGAATAVVTEIAPNDGTTYDVAVSGMTTDGTVIASIPADAAKDIALNGNTASTSTDNTVTFIANRPPTAVADSYSTNKDTPLSVAASEGVLANDTDPDGDPITAELVDDVDNGTLTLSPDGSFTYTPDDAFFGEDSFTYRANDGSLQSEEATVSITVTAPTTKGQCKKGRWMAFGFPDQGTCITFVNENRP